MENTLNTYPNLQFNPIKIPDFTLLEIYKESIAPTNGIGYCIIPIRDKTKEEIEQEIESKAATASHEGYTKLKVLSTGDYNHKIVYAVWYEGDEPTYPQEPEVSVLTPAPPLNIWKELEVENVAAPTYITVTLTCSAFDKPLEFYINHDYFAIDIEKPEEGVNEVIVSREGVSYNGKPIDSFKMTSAPKLKAGTNSIKVNSVGISHVGIKYRMKY